jgi:hypothetical protein
MCGQLILAHVVSTLPPQASLTRGAAGGAPPPHALLMARTPPEDDVAPELLAVQTLAGGVTTRLTTLDAWTGATLHTVELPFAASRILQTSLVDSEGRKLMLMVDSAHRGHVFPATPEVCELSLRSSQYTASCGRRVSHGQSPQPQHLRLRLRRVLPISARVPL